MKNLKLLILLPALTAMIFLGCESERNNPNDPLSILNIDDAAAPVVESIIPSDNSEDVELDRSITVKFSETMDRESTESAFSLTGSSSGSGAFDWTDYDKAVTFSPDAEFGLYNEITASIGSTAADVHENNMAAVSVTFTTRGPVGVLDDSFGGGGKTEFDDPTLKAIGNAAVLDSEGRILVTGRYDEDMCIWRYNADGTLDTTFNNQGWATHDNAAGGNGRDEGYDITLDKQGRIFVTGKSASDDYADMAVWRYTEEGVLYGFSAQSNKPITFNAGRSYSADEGRAIVVDDSGNIYVAGTSVDSTDYPMMALWCYNSDGSEKTAFGNGGIITTSEADTVETVTYGQSTDLALDSEGRIVIAGYYEFYESPSNRSHIVIRRYKSDGTKDLAFSDDALLTSYNVVGGTNQDTASGLYIDDSNEIYVTGSIDRNNTSKDEYIIVMKIEEDGDWDLDFNSTGYVTLGIADGLSGDNNGLDLKIDQSGKILVAGLSIYGGSNPDTRMTVSRFNEDGSLDTGFNEQGWVIFANMDSTNSYIFRAGLLSDSDSKIIVAGTDLYDMTIWRYK